MNITEKIIARLVGRPSAAAGEYFELTPDLLIVHEFFLYPQTIDTMQKLGIAAVANPDRMMVVFDHGSPAISPKWAEKLRRSREFVREQGIRLFYDVGWGISHQISAELGHIVPGMFVTNGDPHVTAYGAFDCFAPTIGSQAQLELVLTGSTWFQVPEVAYFELLGNLPDGVSGRDIFAACIREVGIDGVVEMTMEFGGPGLARVNVDERITVCDLVPLAGALNGVIAFDPVTEEYLRPRVKGPLEPIFNDPGTTYARTVPIQLDRLEPLVALPGDPLDTVPVGEMEPYPIDQGFIGSCSGGRLSDMRVAARILKGRSIKPGVRLLVAPASKEVYLAMVREGLAEIFVEAGATVESPGCGACWGLKGALADGEVCVANSTQNSEGRMGSPQSKVFLGNAAVVAASSLEGRLADPRPYLS